MEAEFDVEPAAELARLRALVGPSETDFEAMRHDRDEAQHVAKEAMAQAGELRGTIEEMSVQLARARQDQDMLLRRASLSRLAQVADRARHRWHTSVVPRLVKLAPRRSRTS